MIAREWRAEATAAGAEAYRRHVTGSVLPALGRIAGHCGAYMLQRRQGDREEIVVVSLWDSMAAISAFAGSEPEQAVVEPEAKAVLLRFDDRVAHYQVLERVGLA
jgi:heme-degrading monooxygenase HmoA